ARMGSRRRPLSGLLWRPQPQIHDGTAPMRTGPAGPRLRDCRCNRARTAVESPGLAGVLDSHSVGLPGPTQTSPSGHPLAGGTMHCLRALLATLLLWPLAASAADP